MTAAPVQNVEKVAVALVAAAARLRAERAVAADGHRRHHVLQCHLLVGVVGVHPIRPLGEEPARVRVGGGVADVLRVDEAGVAELVVALREQTVIRRRAQQGERIVQPRHVRVDLQHVGAGAKEQRHRANAQPEEAAHRVRNRASPLQPPTIRPRRIRARRACRAHGRIEAQRRAVTAEQQRVRQPDRVRVRVHEERRREPGPTARREQDDEVSGAADRGNDGADVVVQRERRHHAARTRGAVN